jgi:hypothetical protein
MHRFRCRCRGDVLNGVTVRTGGDEPGRGSLSDHILIAENHRPKRTRGLGRVTAGGNRGPSLSK